MAASRPILAIGGSTDDAVQQILRETESGYHASSIADIKSYVKARYSEYISTGKVASTGNKDTISHYSQREMARKFSDILEQITSRR